MTVRRLEGYEKGYNFGNVSPSADDTDKSSESANIVRQFVNDAGKCVEQVKEAVEGRDAQTLQKAAHGLKGISGNVGAMRLQ